jgi:hypothetical protein
MRRACKVRPIEAPRQPARGFQPGAKLHGLGKAVQDLKLAALRSGNQHAARIRAQIHGGIKRTGRAGIRG